MPPSKRRKIAKDIQNQDEESSLSEQISDEPSSEELSNTDEEDIIEITSGKQQKSRQTSKRKIRATKSSTFGIALQSLLSTDAPSTLPLSLKPSIARKRNDEKLELRAKRILQVEKKEREDKGRITDIIGGWGGESERALRKVAQRGVVKLFNTIQQSQAAASVAADDLKAARGSGKPTLPAPSLDSKAGKVKNKVNPSGGGREDTLDKNDFFDMIRSGGIVSKV